jgi:hypothetical protein
VAGFANSFELSNISDGDETAGSHLGSQWRQTSAYVRPRSATIIASERHMGRCPAASSDRPGLLWEQEAAGSNPATPTVAISTVATDCLRR